jgi:KipI family sensor histidine kinase inhibitor
VTIIATPQALARPLRFLPAGPRALLLELDDLDDVQRYYLETRRRQRAGKLPTSVEVVPAARTILFDGVDDCAALAREISDWAPGDADADVLRDAEIPTVYDGPDLHDVAVLWNMTRAEVVATHTATVYVVAFLGFAPGFAYLSGLPTDLAVPRRAQPRTKVPIGSVALADQFTGVYPRESPGGWQLLGRTSARMWDQDREPAALLVPGVRVRFVEVTP